MSTPREYNDDNNNDLEKPPKGLQKSLFWGTTFEIHQWEGYWFAPDLIIPAMKFRSHFHARDDDVLLASSMKTGTTWLKSLALCIINNNHNAAAGNDDFLAKENPHFLLPTVESAPYSTKPSQYFDDLYSKNPPSGTRRLLHTHLPFALLPVSVKSSACKIVYIARNPKDTLISTWHYYNSNLRQENQEPPPYPLEEAVDCFCSGIHPYGPYFDHVLEYWLESEKNPEKILFVRYEEMIGDPKGNAKKIAEFVGKGFRDEAEVDEVLWRCSLDRLKSLEVNKSGNSVLWKVPNSSYFRKGVVGDWRNYLTAAMEEKVDRVSREKLEPCGLFL